MTVLFLLLVFGLWLSASADTGAMPHALISPIAGLLVFLFGYGLLALAARAIAVRAARSIRRGSHDRMHRWFNWIMLAARGTVPGWFAVALYVLGWGNIVDSIPTLSNNLIRSPAALVGVLPAMLAWMGLVWAAYPADLALREVTLLDRLDASLPVYAPPRFWPYFGNKLRMQVLFTIVPVLGILLLSDVFRLMLTWLAETTLGAGWGLTHPLTDSVEMLLSLSGAALVLIAAPEALRRVLRTRPLPASPLRDRLEDVGRRTGMRYREILLWDTGSNTGNAAVMGLFWRVRYVLLSDLLVETMTDVQIEAVFAHEIGHVRHRHLLWFVVFFIAMNLGGYGIGQAIAILLDRVGLTWKWSGLSFEVALVAGIILCFGYLSRWFERQADVFASDTISHMPIHAPTPGSAPADATSLAIAGDIFADALHRVAYINGIPILANNWTHGSIASRMSFIRTMARDGRARADFDRRIRRVYQGMIAILMICAASAFFAWKWLPDSPSQRPLSASAVTSPQSPGSPKD